MYEELDFYPHSNLRLPNKEGDEFLLNVHVGNWEWFNLHWRGYFYWHIDGHRDISILEHCIVHCTIDKYGARKQEVLPFEDVPKKVVDYMLSQGYTISKKHEQLIKKD